MEPQEEKGPLWMNSYADMITILLALFIMLFGMSTVEIRKLKAAAGSLREAFGGPICPYPDLSGRRPGLDRDLPARPLYKHPVEKEGLLNELDIRVRANQLQNKIQVFSTPQGIVFRMESRVLFDSGESTLKLDSYMALQFIANELAPYTSNPIVVDGHTDPMRYSSNPDGNWDLAAQRAYAVMNFLIDYGQLSENRMAYESNAEFRPLSDADNQTAVGRARNRRAEITLLQTDERNWRKRGRWRFYVFFAIEDLWRKTVYSICRAVISTSGFPMAIRRLTF